MKLVSEELLPKSKRKDASKAEVLSAYEELEQMVISILDNKSVRFYEVCSRQLANLIDQADKLHFDISSEDDKGLDRLLEIMEKSKKFFEGLKYVEENSSLSKFLSEKTTDSVLRHAKN